MKQHTTTLVIVTALASSVCFAETNLQEVAEAIAPVVENAKGAHFTRYAGVWLVQYQNGASRQYSIEANGEVAWIDFDPAKKCTITVHLIDFEDGKLERISRKGSVIQIEHFDPAAKYRNKLPGIQGTGTKIKK